jgi:hypothetical protein
MHEIFCEYYSRTPKIRGYCKQCKEELREDYEYYIDNNDNKYCSCECAIKYYGIYSKDWEEEE